RFLYPQSDAAGARPRVRRARAVRGRYRARADTARRRGIGRTDQEIHNQQPGGAVMTGIPFVITFATKAALYARGFTDEEITNLKREEAKKILNGGGPPPQPNRAEAERFLQALDPSPNARWCFQTFTDDKKVKKERADGNKRRKQQGLPPLKDPLAAWQYGTLAEHYNWLVKQNARGAGISCTVNETDGKGRKKTNITRIRAFFEDLDGSPIEPVANAKLKPHIIVQSSPGRFQTYKRFTGRMPLKIFEPLQKALAD